MPFSGESIAISDRCIGVDSKVPSFAGSFVPFLDGRVVLSDFGRHSCALPRPQQPNAGGIRVSQREIKVLWEGEWKYRDARDSAHFISGCLTRVFDFNIGNKAPRFRPEVLTVDYYVSSQLTFGSAFRQHSLPFASFPEPNGCPPKPDGREGQNNGEPGDNGLVVVVSLDELKPPLREKKHSSREGGAILLVIVVGGLFGVFRLYQTGRRP
jgi:hypothetical protein